MKKLLALGLFVALLLACSPARAQVGPINPILCDKAATFTGTGAAAIVITGAAGTNISVCGWTITNTATTGTFAITTGGGAGCGTNTVNITPALSITSTAPSTDHASYATFSAGTANNVCVNATVTTVTGTLWYSNRQ